MADTATPAVPSAPVPGVPTSTELLDLLAALDNAWRDASDSSSARDRINAVLDPAKHEQLHQIAVQKHYALGVAKEALRSAIARTRSVLDHVHSCEQPSNGELVRTVADRDRRIQELISERDEARLAAKVNASVPSGTTDEGVIDEAGQIIADIGWPKPDEFVSQWGDRVASALAAAGLLASADRPADVAQAV